MPFIPFAFLDDNLSDAGDLVSVDVFQQIADNCNYLIDSMPVGSIIPVMVGIPGCPTPDPLLWKECDGEIIMNQDSALRNEPAPNYADAGGRYMRGYVNPGTIGFYGGSNTKDLRHNHGGQTEIFSTGMDNSDTDEDFITVYDHSHPISQDLQADHNFEPAHVRVKHYIKIA